MSQGRFVSLPNGRAAFELTSVHLGKYRDPEKRRAYMRELMAKKRARKKAEGQ